MPPVRDPDPLDSSLDVKSDTFLDGLRGIECAAVEFMDGENRPDSDVGGLFVGEVDAR